MFNNNILFDKYSLFQYDRIDARANGTNSSMAPRSLRAAYTRIRACTREKYRFAKFKAEIRSEPCPLSLAKPSVI